MLPYRAQQIVSEIGTRARRAAKTNQIGMHPAEMPRRFMLLGVADGAESAVCLDRDIAERRSGISDRGRGEDMPLRIALIVRLSGRVECKTHTIQTDQAIGELVLDGLKLADELSELLPDPSVLDS